MLAGNKPPHVVFNQFWRGLMDPGVSLDSGAYPGWLDGWYDGKVGQYDGLVGLYDGLVGEYDGLVGLYDGLVGEYDGLVGLYAGVAPTPAGVQKNGLDGDAIDGLNPAAGAGAAPPNSPPAAGAGAGAAPPKSPPAAGALLRKAGAHLTMRLAGGGCAPGRPKSDFDFGIRAPYLLHLKESGAQ